MFFIAFTSISDMEEADKAWSALTEHKDSLFSALRTDNRPDAGLKKGIKIPQKIHSLRR